MNVVIRQLPEGTEPPEHVGLFILTEVGNEEKLVGPFLDPKEATVIAGYHGLTVVEE